MFCKNLLQIHFLKNVFKTFWAIFIFLRHFPDILIEPFSLKQTTVSEKQVIKRFSDTYFS